MTRIGVRQLQQNAATVVRRVRRGERIEITDRGRPVAVLSPLPTGDPLDILESAGRVDRAEGDLLALGEPLRLKRGAVSASSRLARLRAEER